MSNNSLAKRAIEYVCYLIEQVIGIRIPPEAFRLAKFNDPQPCSHFWKVLFGFICLSVPGYRSNGMSRSVVWSQWDVAHKEDHVPSDVVVCFIFSSLAKAGYSRPGFFTMTPTSQSSRELLLATGWLLASIGLLDEPLWFLTLSNPSDLSILAPDTTYKPIRDLNNMDTLSRPGSRNSQQPPRPTVALPPYPFLPCDTGAIGEVGSRAADSARAIHLEAAHRVSDCDIPSLWRLFEGIHGRISHGSRGIHQAATRWGRLVAKLQQTQLQCDQQFHGDKIGSDGKKKPRSQRWYTPYELYLAHCPPAFELHKQAAGAWERVLGHLDDTKDLAVVFWKWMGSVVSEAEASNTKTDTGSDVNITSGRINFFEPPPSAVLDEATSLIKEVERLLLCFQQRQAVPDVQRPSTAGSAFRPPVFTVSAAAGTAEGTAEPVKPIPDFATAHERADRRHPMPSSRPVLIPSLTAAEKISQQRGTCGKEGTHTSLNDSLSLRVFDQGDSTVDEHATTKHPKDTSQDRSNTNDHFHKPVTEDHQETTLARMEYIRLKMILSECRRELRKTQDIIRDNLEVVAGPVASKRALRVIGW
eukprot:Rmarinus@m.25637